MTTTDILRTGAFGFAFEAVLTLDGVVADISAANLLEVRFQKPDSTVIVRAAQLGTTGLDGLVVYVVQPGDIDQAGDWRYQFDVGTPTFRFPLDPVVFKVGHNIL
jgi:hypothetical protein